jgi:hypothetical protein
MPRRRTSAVSHSREETSVTTAHHCVSSESVAARTAAEVRVRVFGVGSRVSLILASLAVLLVASVGLAADPTPEPAEPATHSFVCKALAPGERLELEVHSAPLRSVVRLASCACARNVLLGAAEGLDQTVTLVAGARLTCHELWQLATRLLADAGSRLEPVGDYWVIRRRE